MNTNAHGCVANTLCSPTPVSQNIANASVHILYTCVQIVPSNEAILADPKKVVALHLKDPKKVHWLCSIDCTTPRTWCQGVVEVQGVGTSRERQS